MSLTDFLEAKKVMSSIKERAVISGFSYSILLNIPLRYRLNKIGDTRAIILLYYLINNII